MTKCATRKRGRRGPRSKTTSRCHSFRYLVKGLVPDKQAESLRCVGTSPVAPEATPTPRPVSAGALSHAADKTACGRLPATGIGEHSAVRRLTVQRRSTQHRHPANDRASPDGDVNVFERPMRTEKQNTQRPADHYSHALHITGTVRAFHEGARAAPMLGGTGRRPALKRRCPIAGVRVRPPEHRRWRFDSAHMSTGPGSIPGMARGARAQSRGRREECAGL